MNSNPRFNDIAANRASSLNGAYEREGVDLVAIYLRDIGRYPLLGPEEERSLAFAAKDGDKQSLERLILSNLRLVVYAARDYATRGSMAFLDLVQEGNLGLLRAIEKFDPQKGFRFSTYAMWWIHHAIRRALAKESRTVRLPLSVIQLAQKIDEFEQTFLDKNGAPPTDEQVAIALGITQERISKVRMALQSAVSLEESTEFDGEEKDVNDFLTDEGMVSPEQEAFRHLWWEALERELPLLSPRQLEVFRMRYGLEDGTAHTLASIGKKLRISRERARQLENQAIQKLRRAERLQELAKFIRADGASE